LSTKKGRGAQTFGGIGMQTEHTFKRRLRRLWKLTGRKAEALLITSPENVRYLSGFTGSEGSLLISRTGGCFMTDGRYTTQAREQVTQFPVVGFKNKFKTIGSMIKKMGIARLGFEARHMTVAVLKELEKELPTVEAVACAGELDMLRAIKHSAEIRVMHRAARIAGESLQETLAYIRPGVAEIEIAAEIEYRMRRKGGSAPAFATIVASGHRSALPHGVATARRVQPGELITIDFGTVCDGYCSDETCTLVVGAPTAKQKRVYAVVKQAHDRALRAVMPGAALTEVDAAARQFIARAGFGARFSHGTGHGLGMCVHEAPVVSPRSTAVAARGMVITIEPGVYLPGWGGVRIEDSVVVTAAGCQLITGCDKRLICVGE
jgi:Xaa-Pro aminopeptidase